VAAIGVETLEDLARQFTGRRQHQHAAGLGLRLDAVCQDAVQDRQPKAAVLPVPVWAMPTTSRRSMRWDGLGLDRRGCEVIFFLESARNWIGKAEILKEVKRGSFHYKRQAPGGFGQERARGVRDTRVFGASVLVS